MTWLVICKPFHPYNTTTSLPEPQTAAFCCAAALHCTSLQVHECLADRFLSRHRFADFLETESQIAPEPSSSEETFLPKLVLSSFRLSLTRHLRYLTVISPTPAECLVILSKPFVGNHRGTCSMYRQKSRTQQHQQHRLRRHLSAS